MCMFQSDTVQPSNNERIGYKAVRVTDRGNLTAPILRGVRYAINKWNRAKSQDMRRSDRYSHDRYGNPGFNIFDTYRAANNFRHGNPNNQVVRVIARQVVSQSGFYDSEPGFCAMEMMITSKQRDLAIQKRRNGLKRKKGW